MAAAHLVGVAKKNGLSRRQYVLGDKYLSKDGPGSDLTARVRRSHVV